MPGFETYPAVLASELDTDDIFLWLIDGVTKKMTRAEMYKAVGAVVQENIQTGTTYTIAASDQLKVIRTTNAGAKTLTIPSTTGFELGVPMVVFNVGGGDLTLVVGSGVTVQAPGNTLAQYKAISLIPRATNNWDVIGDLTGTLNTTPAAPTVPLVDDIADTFNWTNNPLFTNLSDYEYTTNAGGSYANVTAKPIVIGNVDLATGQVGVRVKAATGQNASATLFSNGAYTTSGMVDVAPPVLQSATVEDAAPNEIVLTYDEALNTSSTPANAAFTPSGGRTATGVSVSGATVHITVDIPYTSADVITLSYTAGANPIEDIAENAAANLTGQAVTNNVAPSGSVFDSIDWEYLWRADTPASMVTEVSGADTLVLQMWDIANPSGSHPSSRDLLQPSATAPKLIAAGINGLPSVEHSSGKLLSVTFAGNFNRPLTKVIVCKPTTDGVTRYIFMSPGATQSDFGVHSSGKFFLFSSSFIQGTHNVVSGDVYVLVATYQNGGIHELWVNGVKDITGNSGGHATVATTGAKVGAAANGFVGQWALGAYYDAILTDTEIGDLTTELLATFGE